MNVGEGVSRDNNAGDTLKDMDDLDMDYYRELPKRTTRGRQKRCSEANEGEREKEAVQT